MQPVDKMDYQELLDEVIKLNEILESFSGSAHQTMMARRVHLLAAVDRQLKQDPRHE
jgi:hypothetical protein